MSIDIFYSRIVIFRKSIISSANSYPHHQSYLYVTSPSTCIPICTKKGCLLNHRRARVVTNLYIIKNYHTAESYLNKRRCNALIKYSLEPRA